MTPALLAYYARHMMDDRPGAIDREAREKKDATRMMRCERDELRAAQRCDSAKRRADSADKSGASDAAANREVMLAMMI